ncbi:MAG: PH domain-containing protein [Acidobacteriota bacterium]|nr:PH domain-containing protein [Acidobacteriota bacterium]
MRALLLRLLRIPASPAPPTGDDASLVVFRSSPRLLQYSYLVWGVSQFSALFGIALSLVIFGDLAAVGDYLPDQFLSVLEKSPLRFVRGLITPLLALLTRLETLALLIFALQLVTTGLLVKLRWETRWYMVTDTAVRIREGLFHLREQTLTIAKIQNLKVTQGPLQRLFGISDLEIQTAGGGSTAGEEESQKHKAHVGRFRGIDDVETLRNRLRRSLSVKAETGLNDPEQAAPVVVDAGELPAAARELLAESRRLRQTLETR